MIISKPTGVPTLPIARGRSIPRTGLLLYLKSPNYPIDFNFDDELDWDSELYGYRAPADDANVFAAAPWLYDGAASTPLVLSAAEIEARSDVNLFNVWFNGTALAVYDPEEMTPTLVAKIARYFRETVPSFVGGIPAANLLAYNANIFDSSALKFLDSIGASERTLYPLQYIQADGTGYFINSDMVTAGRTITSTTKNGTTTLSSPSAGRLNASAGTLWDFTVTWSDAVVSSYAYCSQVTSTYAVCFDRSGNGRHLVATGFSTLSSVCVSGREFGSDVLNLYGWSAGGLGPELVANGDFSTSTLVWGHSYDSNAILSIENGRLKVSNTASYITLNVGAVAGRTYQVLWEADALPEPNAFIGTPATNVITRNGSLASALIVATGNTIAIKNSSLTTIKYFDNISVKEYISLTVPIPAQTIDPTKDAIGNALTYTGRAKYSIVPKGRTGNCATLASGTSIAITGVTGATVLSKEGTGTVTIGTNVINRATNGTLYNLKLTLSTGRVLTLPLTEGAGTTVWGYDNTGQTYTGIITAADINAFWAGKQTTFFHGLQYGYRLSGSTYIPANPYTTGLACDGNALTAQPLKFNASSGYSLPDAHQARAATGWTYSSANTFYNADGTQIEFTFAQLDTAGAGPRYYLGTSGTALYSVDQSTTDSLIKSTLQV